MSSVIISI